MLLLLFLLLLMILTSVGRLIVLLVLGHDVLELRPESLDGGELVTDLGCGGGQIRFIYPTRTEPMDQRWFSRER